ncbi:putative glucosamine 6-phosphate N-acetyltransferase [Armadillidium nasatum]|uniref:Glucosamine 6-phosphate N-acetyltransferase n=1 Tax=Armadillidium nasatum TaxID=96803 RepID=A0A5N5T437_9CRUS|nr:putative glucosamine 6-phosphate N-acetyltransferase [Armadillidium nasatum]
MKSCRDHYYVTVIEDLNKGKVIGAATLSVEFKFIRECAKRGRLEDVVVDSSYRGKQLGKFFVDSVDINILLCDIINYISLTVFCRRVDPFKVT